MPNFVIEFNRRTRTRRMREFDSPREAMAFRLDLEAQRVDADIEIVALMSQSLEALQRTHSRYFTGEDLGALAFAG